MTTTTTMTGYEAIEHAAKHGLRLSKHADPTEGAREGLTVEEAREIAREDPALVYVAIATTTDTLTTEQIEQLQQEAAQAGDDKQVEICRRALDGNEAARHQCVRAIREAQAQ